VRAGHGPLAGLARFLGAAALLTALLRLAGCVPELADDGALRAYSSLDEAREQLRRPLLWPAVFPERFAFPPVEVRAAKRPVPVVVVHVADRRTGALALSLVQGLPGAALPPSRISPSRLLSSEPWALHGEEVTLEVATCEDERPCNRVRGTLQGRPFELVVRGPREELQRIAGSLALRGR